MKGTDRSVEWRPARLGLRPRFSAAPRRPALGRTRPNMLLLRLWSLTSTTAGRVWGCSSWSLFQPLNGRLPGTLLDLVQAMTTLATSSMLTVALIWACLVPSVCKRTCGCALLNWCAKGGSMRRHILCNRCHGHRTDGVERLTRTRPKRDMSTRGPSADLWPRLGPPRTSKRRSQITSARSGRSTQWKMS